MKFLRSMKGKIVLGTILIVLIGFLGFGVAVSNTAKRNISNAILDNSIHTVEQIASQAEIILSMGGDVNALQQLTEGLIKNNQYLAYAVVIDTNVTAVAHSDKEKIGRSYADDDYTVRGAQKGEVMNSSFYADLQQAWTYDIMVPIYVNGELYGAMDAGVYETYIAEATSQLVRTIMIATCVSLLFIIVLGLILCTLMFKKFQHLVEKCNQMGEGDFSQPLDENLLKRHDEIGIIARAINHMREKLAMLLKKNMSQADSIVAIAEEVDNRTKSTVSLATEIKASLDEVVTGSNHQQQLTSDTTSLMEQISTGMEEVAVNMQKVSDASGSTVANAETGYELVNRVAVQMDTINGNVKETADKIRILSQKSNEIQRVVEFITDIASQTNLLSLNASIEAARAGEHGRGFAVVAEEVGQLAIQSSQAASEIVTLITEIQNDSKSSMDSMSGSQHSIETGLTMAKEAGSSFKDILKQITSMSEEFTNISAITEEVTASTNDLLSSVENISEITINNNNKATEVLENIETQNGYLDDISIAAQELNQMSHELTEVMKVFRI